MTRRLSWGTGVVIVYAIFASGTLAFTVFAMRQHVDLVSDDYYERSLGHERHRAAVEHAQDLRGAFTFDVKEDGRSITLQWPANQVTTMMGTATFYRPSDASRDRVLALAPRSDGRQDVSLAALSAGRWLVQLDWTAAGRDYYVERDVVVR